MFGGNTKMASSSCLKEAVAVNNSITVTITVDAIGNWIFVG